MTRIAAAVLAIVALLASWTAVAGAQIEPVPGEVVTVPIVSDAAVSIDGDLSDWVNLPAIDTTSGPFPSANPDINGRLTWQLVAAGDRLLLAATVTDDAIIAGQNGEQYWLEDSVELYLNFADLGATQYGEGIAQIRVPAVDIGNTDPSSLTISGNGSEDFAVEGFVFATADGWGLEVAIPVPDPTQLVDGITFGFQIQANGASSAGGRDLKIIWSNFDTEDTSFEDPSVFGQAVYLADPGEDGVADVGTEPDAEPVVSAPVIGADENAVGEVDGAAANDDGVGEVNDPLGQDEGRQRALLIAAVVSAISVLIGGIWFERRRKRSEEELAEDSDDPDTPSRDGMPLDSILDD